MFYEQVYERLRLFFERLLIIFPYLRFSIYDGLFAPLYENEPFEFFLPRFQLFHALLCGTVDYAFFYGGHNVIERSFYLFLFPYKGLQRRTLSAPLFLFRKDILYEFIHKAFVVQAGYNGVQYEPFEFFFPDGLFLAVVELVFSASALVIIFLFAE